MSRRNPRKQIVKLVQMLINRYDVSAVYIEDIADCLECSQDVVKAELVLLWEKGILEPVFELHCCLCGGIIATDESPHYLIGGMAAEYPHCWNQSKCDSKDDLVSAWAVRKHTEYETMQPVTSDGAYAKEA